MDTRTKEMSVSLTKAMHFVLGSLSPKPAGTFTAPATAADRRTSVEVVKFCLRQITAGAVS